MNIFCKFEGCTEMVKVNTFQVIASIRYSIDTCEAHSLWAVEYLDMNIKKGDNNIIRSK